MMTHGTRVEQILADRHASDVAAGGEAVAIAMRVAGRLALVVIEVGAQRRAVVVVAHRHVGLGVVGDNRL